MAAPPSDVTVEDFGASLSDRGRAESSGRSGPSHAGRPGGRFGGVLRRIGWEWAGPLLITLVAGILRFTWLGRPGSLVFDEAYYVEEARDYLRYGVEYKQAEHVPEFIVHPPVGKWVIAFGQLIFGNTPLGWRFSVAALGTLAVLLIARIGTRLFRSTLLGCIAGLLLTVDGMAFVHSRTSLLDPILMFFVLAAFGALLVDRDRVRERLAATRRRNGMIARYGPPLGWRPWRLLAGLCLGLACATKWNAAWYLAAFGILSVLWDRSARRAWGARMPSLGMLRRDALPAFASTVLVSLAVYLLSWTGWFLSDDKHAYNRNWAATNPSSWPVPDALRSLWHYHAQMWHFHTTLTSFHPYQSNPWGWLVLARPVSYFYQGPKLGEQGCRVEQCSRAIEAVGTPAIWWAVLPAIGVLLWLWAGARDWRAGAVLAGLAAGYLPWFQWQQRTIFYFYAIVFTPWIVLAVTMMLGLVIGGAAASARRRRIGAFTAGSYVVLALTQFAWLFPILAAQVIPYDRWRSLLWFPSWI